MVNSSKGRSRHNEGRNIGINATPNTNCLVGFSCPECGNTKRFMISAQVFADVTDDGATISDGNTAMIEWNDQSACICGGCGKISNVKYFKGQEQ